MVSSIRRYAQIIDVLGQYGFGIGLERLFPGRARFRLPDPGKSGKASETSTVYERIRLALEDLGPTFVKFGQIMSTRTELLPPEMIDELKKLQDHAKPIPFRKSAQCWQENCPDLDLWFSEIEETPVASASIAQVHRAFLTDGTPVAIKVQRPGIGEIIETDISILQSMAERIEVVFPETPPVQPDRHGRRFCPPDRQGTRLHAGWPQRGPDGTELPGCAGYPFPEDLLGVHVAQSPGHGIYRRGPDRRSRSYRGDGP